ncbi:MAG: hypothetical protein HGA31_02230 [Candidatus Moranbacteria bacterium]|nr:hypothetical protein [Candidatus Moranbacteria bacterium]
MKKTVSSVSPAKQAGTQPSKLHKKSVADRRATVRTHHVGADTTLLAKKFAK